MGTNPRAFSLALKLQELGASPIEVAEVLEMVGDNLSEERVYEVLKRIDPDLAERFRREMSLYVWRSDIRREPFKRERIVKSLVKETGISKSVAEKVAREVEDKVRQTNLTFITSSLIRELALIKLLEYGFEEAYRRYTRLGVPVYDLNVIVSKGTAGLYERLSGRILQQYAILYLFPKPLVEALFEGFVEVGGLTNPFVPYAQTYYTKISGIDRWFEGLTKYLLNREFVDVPSIYVPPFLEEEHLRVIKSIKRVSNAILWSTEDIEGVIKSEDPVYSFGTVPERKVLDLISINLEKTFLSTPEYVQRLEEISEALSVYQERKKEYVKAGNLYIKFYGGSVIPEKDKEKILDLFSDFSMVSSDL